MIAGAVQVAAVGSSVTAGNAGPCNGFWLLPLWFQNTCAFLGQALVAQAEVDPLCSLWLLSLLSIPRVPSKCQPVSASIYLLSVHNYDNFACYTHGHLS